MSGAHTRCHAIAKCLFETYAEPIELQLFRILHKTRSVLADSGKVPVGQISLDHFETL